MDIVERLRRPTGRNAFTQEPITDRLRAEAADEIERLRSVAAQVRSEAILEFCAKAGIGALQQVNGLPEDVKRWRLEMAVSARRAAQEQNKPETRISEQASEQPRSTPGQSNTDHDKSLKSWQK